MRAAFAFVSACFVGACSLFVDTGGLDTETDSAPDATNDASNDVLDASDANPDVSGEAGEGGCPAADGGPTMVALPFGLCIDSTEVTAGQYKQFTSAIAQGYVPVVAPRCAWNVLWNTATQAACNVPDDFPVSCVNWCQAYAFCAWTGKHLCGGRTGGSVPYASFNDTSVSAWVGACSQLGTNKYSFGNTYMQVCNMPSQDAGGGSAAAVAVASEPQCVGPPGVFDMLGNASEWIDSCDEDDAGVGDTDRCHHIGGACTQYMDCFSNDSDPRTFDYYANYPIGFRCCSP